MSIVGHGPAFTTKVPTTNDWVTFVFSDANLPDRFVVRIKDEGQGWTSGQL